MYILRSGHRLDGSHRRHGRSLFWYRTEVPFFIVSATLCSRSRSEVGDVGLSRERYNGHYELILGGRHKFICAAGSVPPRSNSSWRAGAHLEQNRKDGYGNQQEGASRPIFTKFSSGLSSSFWQSSRCDRQQPQSSHVVSNAGGFWRDIELRIASAENYAPNCTNPSVDYGRMPCLTCFRATIRSRLVHLPPSFWMLYVRLM